MVRHAESHACNRIPCDRVGQSRKGLAGHVRQAARGGGNGKRYVTCGWCRRTGTAGRVRHRVLRTLGREDELKASGQLDQLAASFARLDPPPVGTRRHVGPLLLVSPLPAAAGAGELSTGGADARAGACSPTAR